MSDPIYAITEKGKLYLAICDFGHSLGYEIDDIEDLPSIRDNDENIVWEFIDNIEHVLNYCLSNKE